MSVVEGQGRLVEVPVVEEGAAAVERARVGVEKSFRSYDPEQVVLMAPVLSEWLPEGHLAHFVSDLVESGALDLAAVYASYEEEPGVSAVRPQVDGEAARVRVRGRGELVAEAGAGDLRGCGGADAVRRSAPGLPVGRPVPAFAISRRWRGCWCSRFVCAGRRELVALGSLALDGTKLRANASRRKAMSYERMQRKEQELDAEIAELERNVRRWFEEADRVDAEEDELYGPDRRGDELPERLRDRKGRLEAIREAKQALEDEARERETARRAKLEAEGKKPRPPRDGRDPFKPKPSAQRNFTDPESRIMKTADGSFHQCFNGQAVVDAKTQVIIAADVSDQKPGAEQLAPTLDQLEENLAVVGAGLADGATLSADAGYFSADNVRITVEHGLDPHIATGRFKHGEPPAPSPRGRIPKDANPKQLMARKLKTKRGREVYSRRKTIVEPVFGQMTTTQNARQLLLRGKDAARPRGASTARSTTSSSCTATAGSRLSNPKRTPTRDTTTGNDRPQTFSATTPARSHANSAATYTHNP